MKTKNNKEMFFHKLIDLTEILICFYAGTGSPLQTFKNKVYLYTLSFHLLNWI